MKNLKSARLVLALVAAVAVPAFAQNVAVVNGKAIPTSRVEAMVKQMVQQGQKDSPEMRAMIKDELINREVLAQEADRQGVANRPEVKNQIDLARQSIVIRALAQEFVAKNPVKDEELKAEYDKFKSTQSGKEYHARHILVEKEDEAKAIIAKLKDGGTQFEVMSRKEIERIRAQSKAGSAGPWVSHFEEMSKKTVIRRLFKYLPVSIEMARAVGLDEQAEVGIAQENILTDHLTTTTVDNDTGEITGGTPPPAGASTAANTEDAFVAEMRAAEVSAGTVA
mgnify:CR=1 FL=1